MLKRFFGNGSSLTPLFLLVVSVFGLILSVTFTLNTQNIQDNLDYRKPIVGALFMTICLAGALAVAYPNSCSNLLKFKQIKSIAKGSQGFHSQSMRGHHPDCEPFSSHILSFGNRRFCATCTGLLTGAAIATAGTIGWVFLNFGFFVHPFLLSLVGAACVLLGLFYHTTPKLGQGLIRFFASAFFVMGTFLILISVEEAVASISLDLFVVALSVLWILSKIALSQREHWLVCSTCKPENFNLCEKKSGSY
jgi:hypothetical protein